MLEFRSIQQHYGSSHTLRDLQLEAREGEVTTVLGRNGTGKTTLLKAAMGLVPLTSGAVFWQGRDIGKASPEQRVGMGFGFVPQGREIFSRLTVEENIRMGMAALPYRQARTIPGELHELFPVLKDMRHRRGGDLSGGQQQQLAIARALAGRPKVLLLDEPTEGIQPSIIKHIGKVISSLRDRGGMVIVLVEQYYDFAAELADRYAVLSRGAVIQSGTSDEMESRGVRSLLSV
ncbi:MAG: urea ABC transporter ATP-binding subunit UrtE [Fibrobacteria bacterium]|nr:urea ABC transporter ATP-binding subunit UrtE [Fibrobacteria bacterium]